MRRPSVRIRPCSGSARTAAPARRDLTPVVRPVRNGSVITLRRIKEDRCVEVQPQGVEMRWSFEELGLEPGARVSVENPYQLTPSA